MLRPWSALIFITLVVGACAATAPEPEHARFYAEEWPGIAEAGFAVAPIAGVNLLDSSPAAAEFFTDEFYATLQQSLPGTRLTSPDEMYSLLSLSGDDAQARFRSLQRRVVREQEFDLDELAAISRDLQHRYILLGWIDEGVAEGIHKTNLDDFRAFNYSMGVHRYPTEELHGRAIAIMVDLLEGKVVIHRTVDYESAGMTGAEGEVRREVERTRAAAAIRLADRVTSVQSD